MARRIILKENSLVSGANPPNGYRYIGYNNHLISEQVGPTISNITDGCYHVSITTSQLTIPNILDPNNGIEILLPSTLNNQKYLITSILLKMDGVVLMPFAGDWGFSGPREYTLFDNFTRADKNYVWISNPYYNSQLDIYSYGNENDDNYYYLYHSQGAGNTPTGTGSINIYFYYKPIGNL